MSLPWTGLLVKGDDTHEKRMQAAGNDWIVCSGIFYDI